MPRSAAIRGMETVIKPVLMLVRNVMAVNCRTTMMAWLFRTLGCVVVVGRIVSSFSMPRSAEVGLDVLVGCCTVSSSTDSVSCGIVRSRVAKEKCC